MNAEPLNIVPTFGITNIDILSPEIKHRLLDLGKKYMLFVTWEKRHQYYDELEDTMKVLTFQEIIDQEYNGDVDEAMEFLVREFYNTTKEDYLQWLRETLPIETMTPIQATVLQWLCVMKTFVMNSSIDELKDSLGLVFSLK